MCVFGVCERGRESEGADDWFLLVVICSELPVFFASLPVLLAGGGSVSTSCNEKRELYSLLRKRNSFLFSVINYY